MAARKPRTIIPEDPAANAAEVRRTAPARRPKPKIVHAEPEPELFNLDEAISQLEPEFIQCRDFGHSWRPFTARWIANMNHYESILRCGRCETERVRYLGKRGQLLNSKYDYAEGYTMKGAGRMSTSDRDMIRLASIKIVEVRDTVQE